MATKKTTAPRPLLGAHMSIAGGTPLAIERGDSIGCTAVQIFLKSSNRWRAKPIGDDEAAEFKRKLAASGVRIVFGHDSYLINLASPKDALYRKSIDSMTDEVERAARLGVPFIVIHPGSHMGEGDEWGLQRVVEGIDAVFARTPDAQVSIAFEITAGQGTNLGYKFEQIAYLIESVSDRSRAGACFDTCHAFAAGYDLRTPKAYKETMKEFDRVVGLKNLLAVHLNDAKGDLGGRLDRHDHIGKGRLGLDAFRCVMTDPALRDVPKVLETPKGPDMKEDVENMKILLGLMKR
ncbi:deoxyribonuclease IV [Candidatus Sumerlaeota bacterium]|nr:deoxyribonuclease IV [Candidatus Sumerlaeota bacterium]